MRALKLPAMPILYYREVNKNNLLGRQSNLLGWRMPTQLTCYLPPCTIIISTSERHVMILR